MNKKLSMVIGRVTSLLLAIETSVFAFSLIIEMIVPGEFAKILGYVASLLIAISVVIMMACLYDTLRETNRILGLLAFVSAVIYAPFCISTYFLQLTVVALNPLELSTDVVRAINFMPGSLTFAMDMLGYFFLCLSTLAAGFALKDPKDKLLRALCIIHGALAVPTFASPIISGLFRSSSDQTNDVGSYVLLFWCVVFVPIALLFSHYYRDQAT